MLSHAIAGRLGRADDRARRIFATGRVSIVCVRNTQGAREYVLEARDEGLERSLHALHDTGR